MSEHLKRAKESLNSLVSFMKGKSWQEVDFLAAAMDDVIHHLEAQQETPASGLTSPESAGASPETSTTSTLETGIMGRINLPSAPGNFSAGTDGLVTPPEKSKTDSPTSSTPATDRTTGPSVSISERLRALPHYNGPGAVSLSDVLHEIAMFALDTPASTSPTEDASREEREAAEDFANDLCVNLDIEPFSEEGERMQAAVIRTWTEQGYPHGGPR